MVLELRPFDAVDYLDGPQEAVAFLNDALLGVTLVAKAAAA